MSPLRGALVAAAVAVAALLSVPGTAAAEPTLTVSPSSGLDPDGAFVVVSGSGYPANAQLFVMQCRSTSTDDHVCNSVGLRKVTTDANGSFTANAMRLVARFGATDCTTTACSVMTSAVSGHSGDRSLDRASAIAFAAPAQPAPPPPPTEPAPPPPPPAPEPPAPGAPAAPGTSVAVGDTTPTSADPGSSVPTTTTTSVDADDPEGAVAGGSESGSTDGDEAGAESSESSEAALTSSGADPDDDGDGGGAALLVVAAVAAVAAAAGGALAFQRRRGTATA